MNTTMFGDDQVIIQNLLQRLMFKLQQVRLNYNTKTSVQKTKTTLFMGKKTKTKIILEYRAGVALAVDHKSTKFQSICGTIRRMLSRKTRNETRLIYYSVMTVSYTHLDVYKRQQLLQSVSQVNKMFLMTLRQELMVALLLQLLYDLQGN